MPPLARLFALFHLLTCLLAFAQTAQAQDVSEMPKGVWSLVSFGEEQLELTEQEQRHRPFLEFGVDPAKVFGLSGCNRFHGAYKFDGTNLIFQQMATTMMACPPKYMQLEQRFLSMLGKVRKMKLQDSLLLLDENDCTQAVFTRN